MTCSPRSIAVDVEELEQCQEEEEQFRWVLIKDEWWLENEEWEIGCSGWKLFEESREPVPEKQN